MNIVNCCNSLLILKKTKIFALLYADDICTIWFCSTKYIHPTLFMNIVNCCNSLLILKKTKMIIFPQKIPICLHLCSVTMILGLWRAMLILDALLIIMELSAKSLPIRSPRKKGHNILWWRKSISSSFLLLSNCVSVICSNCYTGYVICVWNVVFPDITQIAMLHRKFIKELSGINWRTANVMVTLRARFIGPT